MNNTESSPTMSSDYCINISSNDEYKMEETFFRMTAIIFVSISCPPTILMNVLVIVAVKTRRRLQTTCHVLLACLAATDVLVGVATEPYIIAREVAHLTKSYSDSFGRLNQWIGRIVVPLCMISISHLVLLSVERFIAVKYSLRYLSMVTPTRVTIGVNLSWIIPFSGFGCAAITKIQVKVFVVPWIVASLFAIIFCHLSVFLKARSQERSIITEQVSLEVREKFLREKKAWKTTSILLAFILICYLPSVLRQIVSLQRASARDTYLENVIGLSSPITIFFVLLNSLGNPIIYCWRNKEIRKAFRELLTRNTN